MADATSLTPPSPGLSATLLSNESVEHYSPKGPENVKITTMLIHPYIEATMWIHQHTVIPDAWEMWIHSCIVMSMWIHQYIKKPSSQAMWIHAYIAMFSHFEGIPHK